jgi:hypothetical protein
MRHSAVCLHCGETRTLYTCDACGKQEDWKEVAGWFNVFAGTPDGESGKLVRYDACSASCALACSNALGVTAAGFVLHSWGARPESWSEANQPLMPTQKKSDPVT